MEMDKLTLEQLQALVNGFATAPEAWQKRVDMWEDGDAALASGYFQVKHNGFTLAEIREAHENIARRH